jgi:hypothetical protein
MCKVNKVQKSNRRVIPEIILLEEQSQTLPSPLHWRIVKKYWMCTERALRVYVQHFMEDYKTAFSLISVSD